MQVAFCNHDLHILIVFTCIICEDGYGIVAGGLMKACYIYVGFTPMKQVKRQKFFFTFLIRTSFVLKIKVML